MDDREPTHTALAEGGSLSQGQAPIFSDGAPVEANHTTLLLERREGDLALGGAGAGAGELGSVQVEDEMLRRQRAENLPLLNPTLDLLDGPTSLSPSSFPSAFTSTPPALPLSDLLPTTTTTPAASSLQGQDPATSHQPLPLERLPSSSSDDFGDFVDAPQSAAFDAAADEAGITVLRGVEMPGYVDPLLGPTPLPAPPLAPTPLAPLPTTSAVSPWTHPPPPPPLSIDPLSFMAVQSDTHAQQPTSISHPPSHAPIPARPSILASSSPPLPPTPSTSSSDVPPPLPPKPASNLVDELLAYERGGLALFSGPGFRSGLSSQQPEGEKGHPEDDAPPVPPPKPKSPWTSRSATPTPHTRPAVAYQADKLLSPIPVYAAATTPPNTAANPSGVFVDHPLAPSPNAGGRPRTRTPPKVTTPHLPLGKLSSASSSVSNLNGSSLSTNEGHLGEDAEREVIAHHIGLIDDDYFSSREPADASSLVVPVPVRGISRSRSRGSNTGSTNGGGGGMLGSLLGGSSPSLRASPSLGTGSPSWGSRGGSRARDAVGGGELERGGGIERLGEGIGITRRGTQDGGDLSFGEGSAPQPIPHEHRHHHHHHQHQQKRTLSSSYGSSGLWGLWKGAPGPQVYAPGPHVAGSPEERSHASAYGHDHTHPTTTSPQPVEPTILEGQPMDGSISHSYSSSTSTSASPSPERQRERRRSGYFDAQHGVEGGLGTDVHAQGKSGRALPKARMSLESIQQKWMDHDSRGGPGHSPSNSLSSSSGGSFVSGGLAVPSGRHRDRSKSGRGNAPHDRTPSPSRSRRYVPIDPPTITHTSPFGPAPPPTSSSFFNPSSLHAGFGDPVMGALVSSAASSSSTLGSGSSKNKPNPFATHTFAPIAGAPGFKPDGYDWDKGFSDELERELSLGGVGSPTPTVTPTTVTVSPESVSPREKSASNSSSDLGLARGGQAANGSTGEKVLPSGSVAAMRDRGRQPRPKESQKHKEREPSLYQAIGSAFGLWGGSSSPLSPKASASAPRTPPLSSSGSKAKSGFGVPKEKHLGYGQYNGHERSSTTPHLSRGENEGGGERGTGTSVHGVGELIEKKVGGLELVGRKESTVGVLERGVGDKLRAHLPPLSRLPRTWTLLYSMDQHGISLNTLYALCEAPEKNRRPSQSYVGIGGHILVVRDADPAYERDTCFGVYIANGVSHTKTKGFYGGGDSFLFRYHGPTDKMEIFHPTGRNVYYALCDKEYVAFGGGGNGYALWVGEDLLEGTSAGSVCFGNKGPVCFAGTPKPGKRGEGGEMEFEVVGLEVWGVGPT